MSKTKAITANKLGNVVNVFLNGGLHQKICATKELATDFFEMILEVGSDLTDENVMKIMGFMNERTRIAMECGLETDPQTGEVYLAGFTTSVPDTLIEVIQDYHENGWNMDAITNFWKLLMLNPDERVRERLFDFIKTHDFVLTPNGYMVVYKAVNYKSRQENDLAEFITNQYLHVRKDWKCSPNKYVVFTDSDGVNHITKKVTADQWDVKEKNITIHGGLGTMFKDIDKYIEDSDTMYTDWYTGKMEILVGQPVVMPRTDCDSDPSNECSYGLHCGATEYVARFGHSGGAVLCCYVNPAHVVAVPNYDASKMRVTEYFPFAMATYDGTTIDIIEEAYFESDYTTYEAKELAEMVEKVRADELPIDTAMKAGEENRDLAELQKIIESRLIDITE